MVCKVKVVGVLVVACGLCEFDQLYEYTSFFRVAGVFHAYAFWINSTVSYINIGVAKWPGMSKCLWHFYLTRVFVLYVLCI